MTAGSHPAAVRTDCTERNAFLWAQCDGAVGAALPEQSPPVVVGDGDYIDVRVAAPHPTLSRERGQGFRRSQPASFPVSRVHAHWPAKQAISTTSPKRLTLRLELKRGIVG